MPDSLDPDSQNLLSSNMETVLYIPALSANAGPATCLIVPQALDYVVYAYVVCLTSGSGDTVPTLTVGYTDDYGSNSISLNMPASATAGQHASSVTCFYATAGSNITYAVGSGVYSNGSTYSVRFIVRIV